MGWTFVEKRFNSAKEFAEECILKDGDFVKHRMVGNHLWTVYENPEVGKKFVLLFLIEKDRGSYGYKEISESMHPYYYDCPLSIIRAAGETDNESAKEWRALVVQYHAEKKIKVSDKFKPGMKIKYGEKTYQLISDLGRLGWSIVREDGEHFRMPNVRMKQCEIVE